MVKTNPNSRFVLHSLDQIRDSRDVVLQIEKTESTFKESNEECYLCEVVPQLYYSRNTMESLTEENIKLSNDNRKLRAKVEKLSKDLTHKKEPAK